MWPFILVVSTLSKWKRRSGAIQLTYNFLISAYAPRNTLGTLRLPARRSPNRALDYYQGESHWMDFLD